MSLALTNDTKNTLSITNESKPSGGTFGTWPTRTFADGGTFEKPGTFLTNDTKSDIAITNESKPSGGTFGNESKNTLSISNETKLI